LVHRKGFPAGEFEDICQECLAAESLAIGHYDPGRAEFPGEEGKKGYLYGVVVRCFATYRLKRHQHERHYNRSVDVYDCLEGGGKHEFHATPIPVGVCQQEDSADGSLQREELRMQIQTAVGGLNEQDQRICAGLMDMRTHESIATELGICRRTVERHMEQIRE